MYSVQRLVHGIALNVLDVLLGWLHTFFFQNVLQDSNDIGMRSMCVCVYLTPAAIATTFHAVAQ